MAMRRGVMYERSRSKPSLVKRSFFFETSRLIACAPGRLLMWQPPIPGRCASREFRPLGFEAAPLEEAARPPPLPSITARERAACVLLTATAAEVWETSAASKCGAKSVSRPLG